VRTSYATVARTATVETEVKRSRFRCRIERVDTEEAARAVVERTRREHWDARHHCSAFVLGPGTGSFFVISLVGLLGYSFLEASAKARLANWATNLAALCVFVPQGAVVWKVAAVMGAGNLLGGYLGARTAVARGTRFVRMFFIVVVSAFIVRIGGDVVGLW
jgi:hypothetical protein